MTVSASQSFTTLKAGSKYDSVSVFRDDSLHRWNPSTVNGKVRIEINLLNADRFLACLLGVLNTMLTTAIATGLSFGQLAVTARPQCQD